MRAIAVPEPSSCVAAAVIELYVEGKTPCLIALVARDTTSCWRTQRRRLAPSLPGTPFAPLKVMPGTQAVEIWMSAEGARAVLEGAKHSGADPGDFFCDLLQQRMSMRRAGQDVDLFLRESADGECLKLQLPADRFQQIVGLLLSHHCLRLRFPAHRRAAASAGAIRVDLDPRPVPSRDAADEGGETNTRTGNTGHADPVCNQAS
jgi:hypothetical protein